jgi:outer membrane protein TolC
LSVRNSAAAAMLFFAVTATPASAQSAASPVFTLAQAVARARAAGFDVRIARAEAAIASADDASARAALRPQLSVNVNALTANEPQLGMPIARQAYGAAALSIPLYSPSNALATRAADITSIAARTSSVAAANDATFTTTQTYRRIQLADAVMTSRHAAVAAQESHLRVTEQRVAAGKSARYLLARDRAALAGAQQAEEDAASERDQAANDLAAMLDLASAPARVEPLERAMLSDSRDAILARAVRQTPSLIAAEQRLNAAGAGLAAARSAYRPSATLTAQSYNGASSPSLGRSGGQIEVTASLPIVDGGSRGAVVAKAQAQYERAAAVRDQIRATATRDVGNAWREYEAASRNTTIATSALADAEEQLRVASLRESAGKAIATEVLDALALAASARETVARSIARLNISIAAIHHAAGDIAP